MLKRLMDIVIAAVLLIGLAPLLLVIALLVRLTSAGPIFYRQERVGHWERPFDMIKFRTMLPGADRDTTRLHRDDPRITPVGRILRRFSLDELPQLWHVLIGEMSLVGPRPAMPHVAARMTLAERRRHAMRPGITGWAQVMGRNALTWRERIALDLWYVDHWSLRLDLTILLRTAVVVVTGSGLYGKDGWNRGLS